MPKELPVDRKYELMIRDDEFNNYIEKYRQWLKKPNNESLTIEVEQLRQRVKDKWNARIHWPESTIQGVTDFWMLVREPYKAVEDARVRGTMIIPVEEEGLNLRKMIFTSFKDNGLIHCPSHKIPIFIDPTILTLHDAQMVKKEVWEIVRAAIVKRKNTIKGIDIPDDLVPFLPDCIEQKTTIKGRDFAVPAGEPEDLAAVFRCKPKIFEKYLRRYDQWERGLYFRYITYVELKVTDPKKREDLFEKYAKADKKPQTITSSMPDDLARAIEKKENDVRKGVDIIYFAIHRKKRPSKTSSTKLPPKIRKPNCPNHPEIDGESKCPLDCPYLIAYLQDFEKDFEKDMPSELPWVSQRDCLDILGDSGDLIKSSGKYIIAYRNNDIEESEE